MSKNGKLRVGVVGAAGHRGSKYATAVALSNKMELVAVIDPTRVQVRNIGDSHQVPSYDSVSTALDSVRMDVCIIAVPHSDYASIASEAIERGIHVIKEKPFAIDLETATNLVVQANRNKVRIVTIAQRSISPIFDYLSHALVRLGTLRQFKYEYCKDLPDETTGWRAESTASGGGVLIDMGYHVFDLLIRLLGEPGRCTSNISYCYDRMEIEHLEDSAVVLVEFPSSRAYGAIVLSRHSTASEEAMEFIGTAGSMAVKIGSSSVTVTTQIRAGRDEQSTVRLGRRVDTERLLSHYFGIVISGNNYHEELSVGISATDLIERAYASARARTPRFRLFGEWDLGHMSFGGEGLMVPGRGRSNEEFGN